MSVNTWRKQIETIAADLRAPALRTEDRQNRLELGLSRLWLAMQSPPDDVIRAYELLDEPSITAPTAPRAADLNREPYPDWAPTFGGDLESVVLQVAIEIRALDQALHECRVPIRTDAPNQDLLAFGGADVFILPRLRRTAPRRRAGQRFKRRGLIHNRLLPTHAGAPIRLFSPSLRGPGSDGGPTHLASAVFERVDLRIEDDGRRFHVDGLDNEAALSETLTSQLDAMVGEGGCLVGVWPELTVTPAMREAAADALADRALDDGEGPGLLMPGSWHVARDGGLVNVAPVLNGLGETLLEVVKRERYQLPSGAIENIVSGDAIPVLLYGDVLIAFGICKDFCERRDRTPYATLDVDLVLVPSYGNANTMTQHEVAAGDLAVGYGSRAFVVQQCQPGADETLDAWGAVLRPPETPRTALSAPRAQKNTLDRTRFTCTIS